MGFFLFYVPAIAKIIRRRFHNLSSHLIDKDRTDQDSNEGPIRNR